MSNLGLHRAMAAQGIAVEQTAVGDRYVLERMNEGGFSLGGEQSGHVIMSRYATTGDGVLTGLHLCAEMARTGRSLAELASVMTVFPQVLINVRGVERSARPTPTSSPACRSPKRLSATAAGAAAPVGHRADGARHGRGGSQDDAQRIAELADIVRG
jgi:phosphoglucosamine mutase